MCPETIKTDSGSDQAGRPKIRPSRILYICYTSPVPAKIGPSRRHYHILEQLVRFYDVELISLGTPEQAALFAREFGKRVTSFEYVTTGTWFPVKLVRKLWLTLIRRSDFLPARHTTLRSKCKAIEPANRLDAIFLSGCMLNGLPLPRRIPVVADNHNVESEILARTAALADTLLRRLYARLQQSPTFREEKRCALKADLVLVTSDCDKRMFEQKLQVKDAAVIPNGVDVEEFTPQEPLGDADEILFTGLMSYYPNQQAVRWFLDDILPTIRQVVPNARLTIAGANPPRWLLARANPELRVTGAVTDMRPFFRRARVVVAPLRIGGGTRVKILEAQAMRRPVVSTSLGAEGLHLPASSIVLADDAQSFARGVVRFLTDASFALQVSGEARAITESYYAWDRIGERLAETLRLRIGLHPRSIGPNN